MDEPTGAPGPASTPPPDPDAVRSDRTDGDPRPANLDAVRAADNGTGPAVPPAAASVPPPAQGGPEFWEYENPAASVLVTEVQELSRKVDMIGTAALAGVWFLGMIVGGAVYQLAKLRLAPAESAGDDEDVTSASDEDA